MVAMQKLRGKKLFNLLILLCFSFSGISLADNFKTPITLGWSGEEVILEDKLDIGLPTVITLSEFSCENTCSALLRQFRKVLVQSGFQPGKDINVISLGVGPLDTWQLARQRALKAYERFPQRNDIEKMWVFAVLDERANPLLSSFGGGVLARTRVDIPRVIVLSPHRVVTSILTSDDLSTENFTKAVTDSRSEHPYFWTPKDKERCLGTDSKIQEDSVGIRIMRLGIIASLLLFFGVVLLLVRK